ncbi:MAG TPA: hypothetical protein VIZ68_02965 [Thermoplasmata archaeon]
MSETVRYRTGALWGVLCVLLLIGTVASAFVVYGVTDLFATGRILRDLGLAIAGAAVASLAFLFLSGLLYRVDRLRGVAHRRVALFE